MTQTAYHPARRLTVKDKDFLQKFSELLNQKRESSEDVNTAVKDILARVEREGDAAVSDLTKQFDRVDLSEHGLRIGQEALDGAHANCTREQLQALSVAADRITAFHARQMPQNDMFTDEQGVKLGQKWSPVQAVGLYVPGGTAAYPSSVLMNALPAKVAGVERLVMTVPTPDGVINPLVLVAAKLVGVDEVYRIGGAQAIGALAYGTQTVAPVDKIVGPGNAFVAAAKRQVFGRVGIDMIAGPSEILVIADGANDPAWIAADLLSQAEHDESSQCILITDDSAFADAVERAIQSHLKTLPRAATAAASWACFGAVILVARLNDAATLANDIAPEHLEIATGDPHGLAERITNAGAVFLGRHTPEAIGDYVAGTNHVLPTARTARFASGLSVFDFLKRTSYVECDADSLHKIGPAAVTLADAEGLGAHALSVSIRLN